MQPYPESYPEGAFQEAAHCAQLQHSSTRPPTSLPRTSERIPIERIAIRSDFFTLAHVLLRKTGIHPRLPQGHAFPGHAPATD